MPIIIYFFLKAFIIIVIVIVIDFISNGIVTFAIMMPTNDNA